MKKLLALVLSLVMLCSVFAVASAENGEKITDLVGRSQRERR